MILRYRGEQPLEDPRFVAQPGDLVEFAEDEARARVEREPGRWEEVKSPDGAQRKGRRGIQADD